MRSESTIALCKASRACLTSSNRFRSGSVISEIRSLLFYSSQWVTLTTEKEFDIHCIAMYRIAMLAKELVAASTEPLILSLLSKGESYGYALIQEVKRLSGDKIEWTDGMLYPVLHRMEREGWIESRWSKAENGRKRKYYF